MSQPAQPSRVERLLAKANFLKLDDPDTPKDKLQRPQLHTTFSSTDSIRLAARAVRQNQGVKLDESTDEEDPDGLEGEQATANPPTKKKSKRDLAHAVPTAIQKLKAPDADKHPRWYAIYERYNDAFQKAPPPVRFVGGTLGFVGNSAVTVGRLPFDLIVKGIRKRSHFPETEAALRAGELAWDEVDPTFPQNYSTAMLGYDELDTQRAQLLHPVVSDDKLPKVYPYPHAVASHEPYLTKVRDTFIVLFVVGVVAFAITWYLLILESIGASTRRTIKFLGGSATLVGCAVFFFVAVALIRRRIFKEIESYRNALFTARAKSLVPPMPESVEWFNAAIQALWQQIDPKLFVPLMDQVEDVMQASLPNLINAVKIDDFGIGFNPFQLVALRSLTARTPDVQIIKQGEAAKEDDQSDDQDKSNESLCKENNDGTLGTGAYPQQKQQQPSPTNQTNQDQNKNQTPAPTDAQPGNDEVEANDPNQLGESAQEKHINVEDEAGGFVHLEASFSYSADHNAPRSSNIHLMLQFFIGAMDLFQFPFPVWVQIEKISGTIRLRGQLVSEPPYLRNLTFTLTGVPKIEVSVVPLVQTMGDILDIPLISSFVQASIAAAANAYVAPNSMTLNVFNILGGDGVKKDTDALGILAVHIEYARELSSQDSNGFSDPYILVMLAKFGQPLYRTRIVRRTLNPVWNEYAFVPITKDDVKNDEQLSIQLWDWDRHSPDDLIGRVTRSVRQLMRRPNKWHSYQDGLRGFEDTKEMEGRLTYSVGFFEKAPLGQPTTGATGFKKLDQLFSDENGLDQVTERLIQQAEAKLEGRQMMKERIHIKPNDQESVRKEKKAIQQRREDAARREALALQASESLHRSPNPDYPCGVISVFVESISGLETRDVERGVMGKAREGTEGQDIDTDTASKRVPSAYCEILLNEELTYSTRAKQHNHDPWFSAGIELFCRDWRTANVTICVRDSRMREHDPIMGLVCLDLPDLFSTTSQVTRKFSLADGVAFGKVRCSFVFRSVKLQLPRELRGAEVASLEVLGPITFNFPPSKEVFEAGGSAPIEKAGGKDQEAWKSKLKGGKLIVTVGDITDFLDLGDYNPAAVDQGVLSKYARGAATVYRKAQDKPKQEGDQADGPTEQQTEDDQSSEDKPPSEENPISLLKMPLFQRYQTNAIFGINPHLGVATLSPGRKCDAYAVQWMGDLPDCLPDGMKGAAVGGWDQNLDKAPVTFVSLPIIAGPGAEVAAGNYINKEAADRHEYGIVGEIRVGLRLRPGFHLSHDELVSGKAESHQYESYKRLRGMPHQAEINARKVEEGIVSRSQQKQIKRAKREALHARHRGSYSYGVVRTAVWAKDSMHNRLVKNVADAVTGRANRDQIVLSEV